MGFKTLPDLDADVTTALGGVNRETGAKNPTTIEGYYLGARDVESKYGVAKLHILQTEDGNVGVWGKTNMNSKLTSVELGSMIRISYTGKAPSKKGNDMFKYQVEVDSDNTIEVGNLSASQEDSGYEDSYEDSSSDDDLIEEASMPQRRKVAAATSPVTSSKQDAVRALLRKGKSQ